MMPDTQRPTIRLELTEDEADWLLAVMGLVMQIARKWDDLSHNPTRDHGQRLTNKLMRARLERLDEAIDRHGPEYA